MGEFRQGNRCTVQRHNGDFCDAPSAEDMPFPICGRHAAKLYRHIVTAFRGLATDPLFMAVGEIERHEAQRSKGIKRAAETKPVVYYVQVGEYIKIGYTARLKRRMHSYPSPNKRLLATEPGDALVERQRHNQFASQRGPGREWFKPDAELIDHVNALRKAAGATPIAWQTE